MANKVALVTGGTRGIGGAIATILKENGYIVAATYYGNDDCAKKFQEKTGVKTYKWDVANFEQCEAGLSKVISDCGPIDVLVNNAGITRDGFFHKSTLDSWIDVINTNLNSCYNMCRLVIESMRERGYGRIINISSVNGQKGQVGQVNYSTAKAGVIGFTKALALENAVKGVTVNAIAPGYIETDMTKIVPSDILLKIIGQIPAGRLGQPEEVARAVLFLADEKAGYINGTTLSLNGAQHLN